MQKFESVVIIRIALIVADPILLLTVVLYFDVCDFTWAFGTFGQRLDQTTSWLPVIPSNHVSKLFLLLLAKQLCLVISIQELLDCAPIQLCVVRFRWH